MKRSRRPRGRISRWHPELLSNLITAAGLGWKATRARGAFFRLGSAEHPQRTRGRRQNPSDLVERVRRPH